MEGFLAELRRNEHNTPSDNNNNIYNVPTLLKLSVFVECTCYLVCTRFNDGGSDGRSGLQRGDGEQKML